MLSGEALESILASVATGATGATVREANGAAIVEAFEAVELRMLPLVLSIGLLPWEMSPRLSSVNQGNQVHKRLLKSTLLLLSFGYSIQSIRFLLS